MDLRVKAAALNRDFLKLRSTTKGCVTWDGMTHNERREAANSGLLASQVGMEGRLPLSEEGSRKES